jgi:hypothetical protein
VITKNYIFCQLVGFLRERKLTAKSALILNIFIFSSMLLALTRMSLMGQMKKVGFLYFESICDRDLGALYPQNPIPTVSFKKQTPSQRFLSENRKNSDQKK